MTFGVRELQFMACKSAHWVPAKPIKGRIELLMTSTDVKHVEFCVARRVQGKRYMSHEIHQDKKGGLNDHQECKDGATLVAFLMTFSVKNEDHANSVSRNIINDNASIEMQHGKHSTGKKAWILNEWVNHDKLRQACQTKNGVGRNDKKFHEAMSFVASIKAATKQSDMQKGSLIHADVVNRGLLKENVYLGSALVNMYAKCGALEKAQEVFDVLSTRNIVSWNALIAGYTQHGQAENTFVWFDRMQQAGLSPDETTFTCVLKACGSMGAIEKGIEVHGEMVERGFLSTNIVLGNALLDMYAKCGALEKAQNVFNELPARNIVSWTTLIAGYCQCGQGEKALDCFKHMQGEGLSPDAVMFRCILKACGSIGAADKGQEVHAEIARLGFPSKDGTLGSALVDMYAKGGALAAAQEVFDELPVQDIVSWTALIAGYAQQGQGDKALQCLEEMEGKGMLPNVITLLCLLKACCSIGAADKGEAIHAEAVREGVLGRDSTFGNALVDMYAKCGALSKSYHVFDQLPVQTVVSWTALIAGYGQVGKHGIVFDLFNRMVGEGVNPNSVTFLVVLNSCGYLGLVKEGQLYFDMMSKHYGIVPTRDHCTCMVDLFGRSGHFDKALTVIKRMLSFNHLTMWYVLMTACQKWGNVSLGKLVFSQLTWSARNLAMAGGLAGAQCS